MEATASGPNAIRQVDFIAFFEGIDTDGDGVYRDWQYNYHRLKAETAMRLKGHVGSDSTAPYGVTWNTDLVPDQTAGSIRLMARIQDVTGIWYVTEECTGLSLQRVGKAVRLYRATSVPEAFSVRLTRETGTCKFTIPAADRLADVTSATMVVSTFNGNDARASVGATHYTRVNSWTTPDYGTDHFFDLDYLAVPSSALRSGVNTYTFFCNDSSTGIRMNWPGPQMVVTYVGNYASPAPLAPVLQTPIDNSASVPTSPVLQWSRSSSATSYHVQVALDAGFTSLVVNDSTVSDTTKALSGLAFQSLHYWRVRAKNSAGASAFSATWSFTTNSGALTLVAPADGQLNQAVPALLQWRARGGALAYWLQVSTDPLFGSALMLNDSTVLDTFRLVNGLEGGLTYYWRVCDRTITGPGLFPPPWSFTTALALPLPLA